MFSLVSLTCAPQLHNELSSDLCNKLGCDHSVIQNVVLYKISAECNLT